MEWCTLVQASQDYSGEIIIYIRKMWHSSPQWIGDNQLTRYFVIIYKSLPGYFLMVCFIGYMENTDRHFIIRT